MRLKVKLNSNWTRNSIDILFYYPDFEGNIKDVALPFDKITMKVIDEGEILNPTLSLPNYTLQSLVDALYSELQMIPTQLKDQAAYSDKVLTATKYHLEDMRKLVFESE